MSTVIQPTEAPAPGVPIPTDALAPAHAPQQQQKTIRITTHGKMKHWIAHSLTFFEENSEEKEKDDNRTLIFHTLPPTIDAILTAGLALHREPGKQTQKQITPKAASSTTDMISRLISVVELVKREYMSHLNATRSPRRMGLHQYNEIGTLEALGATVTSASVPEDADADGLLVADSPEAQRSRSILQAMAGKNHPRQTQTPFMRITLSLQELPLLVENGATYQPPLQRKLSKSAKTRAKKRGKKMKLNAPSQSGAQVPSTVDADMGDGTETGSEP